MRQSRPTSPLAAAVAELLRKSGKSARQASIDAGLSTSYVKDILSGKSRDPTVMHLMKLAPALGTTIEALMKASYPTSERLGDRVRLVREFLNMSRPEFAAAINIDIEHLAKVEDGSALLPANSIMALKAGFDVSVDWLLDGSRGLLRPDFAEWLAQRSEAALPA